MIGDLQAACGDDFPHRLQTMGKGCRLNLPLAMGSRQGLSLLIALLMLQCREPWEEALSGRCAETLQPKPMIRNSHMDRKNSTCPFSQHWLMRT